MPLVTQVYHQEHPGHVSGAASYIQDARLQAEAVNAIHVQLADIDRWDLLSLSYLQHVYF